MILNSKKGETMTFIDLIQTNTFKAGLAKAIAGVGGVVSGIFICVGTLGGGTPTGALAIIAGIYGISDGISSMAQRNATGNVEANVISSVKDMIANLPQK